jgi:hypothetical protein
MEIFEYLNSLKGKSLNAYESVAKKDHFTLKVWGTFSNEEIANIRQWSNEQFCQPVRVSVIEEPVKQRKPKAKPVNQLSL